MQSVTRLVCNSFLLLCFAFIISSCAIVRGTIAPTPGHQETVVIDSDTTNKQLSERLLVIFAENRIAPCRSGLNQFNNNLPDCFVSWWQGNLTLVDRSLSIIEVGSFPSYSKNIAGHSMRVRRRSEDTLEITVKGVGAYYSKLPNEAVARQLAKIIRENL